MPAFISNKIVYVNDVYNLKYTTRELGLNINEFGLNHVEGDTAIFTIYNKICVCGQRGTVIIDVDIEIDVQAIYVSQKVFCELLIKKKKIRW